MISEKLHLITFAEIAVHYLKQLGYEAVPCASEEEARQSVQTLSANRKWPCYFFDSDTTGEKDFEEFYTEQETLDLQRFADIGIIKNQADFDAEKLEYFQGQIEAIKAKATWQREDLVNLFHEMLPGFAHNETGKFLDGRM